MSEKNPVHKETAAGWNIVAESKYRDEYEEHIELLSKGGHNLLPPESESLLPVIRGKDITQFQCSHGLDALGLLNAGASSVRGFDISEEMIGQANRKANQLRMTNAQFVCSDIVEIPDEYNSTADIIYTGRGSIIWIMDIDAWAQTVARVLRSGGVFFIYEGHPLTALWDRDSKELKLLEDGGYFADTAIEYEGFPSSQVEHTIGKERPTMLERQWRPGQVIDALIKCGLRITKFREFPDLFWNQFPEWSDELSAKLPNSYLITAEKS